MNTWLFPPRILDAWSLTAGLLREREREGKRERARENRETHIKNGETEREGEREC